jgi:hypothetical protein
MERPRSAGRSARLAACVLAPIAPIALIAALVPAPAAAHDDDLGGGALRAASLDGTWRLVAPALEGGRRQYKSIGGGRFIWYVVDGGELVASAGGRVSLHDGIYVERIEFAAGGAHAWMVGGVGRFEVELGGSVWRHRGVVTSEDEGRSAGVDELWVREP